MPAQVALISCVKSKRQTAAPARDLYISPLFRKMRAYAEARADMYYILSAEHGLVHPEQEIAPYERTLKTMNVHERAAWSVRVRHDLLRILPDQTEVIFLAGVRYRELLVPFLRDHDFEITVPLEGLSFGHQLQRLDDLLDPTGI